MKNILILIPFAGLLVGCSGDSDASAADSAAAKDNFSRPMTDAEKAAGGAGAGASGGVEPPAKKAVGG